MFLKDSMQDVLQNNAEKSREASIKSRSKRFQAHHYGLKGTSETKKYDTSMFCVHNLAKQTISELNIRQQKNCIQQKISWIIKMVSKA